MSLPKKCPVGPKRKRSARKNLEGPVIRECLQALAKCPDVIYVERRNTGAVQFQDGGFIRFGSKGAADIWCLVKVPFYVPKLINKDKNLYQVETVYISEHIEIECKRSDGKGRQSEDQKTFQDFCNKHHIPYILTISANELMAKIKAISLDDPA